MADKRVKQLVKALREQDWHVEQTKGGHWQAFSPDGVTIVNFANTPSDHRWYQNTTAKARKGGFKP